LLRALRIAPLVRLASRGRDASFRQQRLQARQIDRAPDAGRRARGEPLHEALLVEALPDAVNPPAAERFVERLLVSEAALAGRLLVEADPQLARRAAVRLEPRTKVSRRREISNLHRPRKSNRRDRRVRRV